MSTRRSGAACDTANRSWCGSVTPAGNGRSTSSSTGRWIGLIATLLSERQKRVSEPGSWQSHGLLGQLTTGCTLSAPLTSTSSGCAPRPAIAV